MDYVQFDILHTLRHLGKLPVAEIAHVLGKDRVEIYMILRDMETNGLTRCHIDAFPFRWEITCRGISAMLDLIEPKKEVQS